MKLKGLPYVVLAVVLLLTNIFGAMYAIHNMDAHHWGFILGTTLDHLQGKDFFTETYIQYGVGEPILFGFLSHVLPIHYTSLGILTSLIYSGTLLTIFFTARRISDSVLAVALAALAFFLHNFSIYPWPDYYAGLLLALACYSLVRAESEKTKKGLRWATGAGGFLFFAFLFRNTYLLGFIAAASAYVGVSLFRKSLRSRSVFTALAVGFGLIAGYLVFLKIDGTLTFWFAQTLGAGTSQYGISLHSILDLIFNVFFPSRPYLPNQLVRVSLSLMWYIALWVILKSIFGKPKGKPALPFFFSLLAFGGIVQATLIFEVFRIQNSCVSLYFVTAFFIAERFPRYQLVFKKRPAQAAALFFLILFVVRMPHASSRFPIYEGDLQSYGTVDLPLFRGHRFRPEDKARYETLAKALCDGKSKIVNLTMDSTIPYLCGPSQPNALGLAFYNPGQKTMLNRIDPGQFNRVETGDFQPDELIVAIAPVAKHPQVKLTEIVRGSLNVYRVTRRN